MPVRNALGDDNPVYGSAAAQADVQFFRATQPKDRQSQMYAVSDLLVVAEVIPALGTFTINLGDYKVATMLADDFSCCHQSHAEIDE